MTLGAGLLAAIMGPASTGNGEEGRKNGKKGKGEEGEVRGLVSPP